MTHYGAFEVTVTINNRAIRAWTVTGIDLATRQDWEFIVGSLVRE
jgi:hypothetical protein